MGIIVKNIFVKLYYSIQLVKYYYSLFYQIYSIITTKLPRIKLKLILQIFFKVFNNLVRPNSLILILLIFSIYPYIIDMNPPSLTITQYSIAI